MVKIEIVADIKERMDESWDYADKVLKGKARLDMKKAERTIILTPEIFAKVFSPERIKLMLKIKRNNISNIYQLAKELNRKYEAVHRDIKLLEGFGIIKLRDKDRGKVPFMDEPIRMPELAAG
ncbi:HTH domain-containing protein [Candidatus Woesearchaeota archaeon]|nr:HTH domain-containing protein [Candidatus Woesearchaeota archaeon]